MTLEDKIESIIRRNPGVTSKTITSKAKCDKNSVVQAIYRIRKTGININTEFIKKDESRMAAYTIISKFEKKSNKIINISKSVSSNIVNIDSISSMLKFIKKETTSLGTQEKESVLSFLQQTYRYTSSAYNLIQSKNLILEGLTNE